LGLRPTRNSEDYVDYRGLGKKLLEINKKNAEDKKCRTLSAKTILTERKMESEPFLAIIPRWLKWRKTTE